jgi:hypothetical protein
MTLQLAHSAGSSRKGRDPWTRTVHHGGRTYIATEAMASIFEAHATAAVERGETELVPLLHKEGVDLLLVSPSTTFAVVNIELGLTNGRARKALRARIDFLPAS